MDQSRPFGGQPFPPDHALLVAGAAVAQASTRTAILASLMKRRREQAILGGTLGALVTVFTAEDASAATRLAGSFHPRVAAKVDVVKPGFTFAF